MAAQPTSVDFNFHPTTPATNLDDYSAVALLLANRLVSIHCDLR